MNKGYWVVSYRKVKDSAMREQYAELGVPAILAAGGRVLVREIAEEAREQGLKERTVIIEFPTYEAALAAYESPAYKEALQVLGDAAERDLRIVRGFE